MASMLYSSQTFVPCTWGLAVISPVDTVILLASPLLATPLHQFHIWSFGRHRRHPRRPSACIGRPLSWFNMNMNATVGLLSSSTHQRRGNTQVGYWARIAFGERMIRAQSNPALACPLECRALCPVGAWFASPSLWDVLVSGAQGTIILHGFHAI